MANMNKRAANGQLKSSLDKRFEIDTNIFIVVSVFNGYTFIHIRKYSDGYPTKEGVCFHR